MCVYTHVESPPPGLIPWALAWFFALGGTFPGVGTLELSNAPGWGRKERANPPSVNTATFFIDHTVEWCHFKHCILQFLVSINVFLCNLCYFTPRRHQFMVLALL